MNHAIRILLSAFMLLAANAVPTELTPEMIQKLREQGLEVVDESPAKTTTLPAHKTGKQKRVAQQPQERTISLSERAPQLKQARQQDAPASEMEPIGSVMDWGKERLMSGSGEASGERLTLTKMEEAAGGGRPQWRAGSVWETRLAQARLHDREQRAADLAALRAVWLYEDDEEARKLVDGHGRYWFYGSPFARDDDSLYVYGHDCAEVVAPELAGSPLELCERAIAGLPEERRKVYQDAYNALYASGNDTKRDWYGLYGRMVRDEVLEEYRQNKKRQTITLGLDALIAGWETNAPYRQTCRQHAIAAFGETWVKEYETATPANRAKLAAKAYEQHTRQPDWENYRASRQKSVAELAETTQKEAQAYQEKQEKAQQAKQQQQRKRTLLLAGRATVITIAAALLATLLAAIKRLSPTWRLPQWASLLAAILLGIAILGGESWFHWLEWSRYELPDGYYTTLRLAVTATAILLATQATKTKAHPLLILLWAALALLFQPLIKVTLERDTWLAIDLIAMLILLSKAFIPAAAKRPKSDEPQAP